MIQTITKTTSNVGTIGRECTQIVFQLKDIIWAIKQDPFVLSDKKIPQLPLGHDSVTERMWQEADEMRAMATEKPLIPTPHAHIWYDSSKTHEPTQDLIYIENPYRFNWKENDIIH